MRYLVLIFLLTAGCSPIEPRNGHKVIIVSGAFKGCTGTYEVGAQNDPYYFRILEVMCEGKPHGNLVGTDWTIMEEAK